MSVIVYNTDGVNPYAAEVSALLARRGDPVTLIDTANSDHRPPAGVRWRRLLPANYDTASRARQVTRLLRGLGATLWAAVAHGDVVVVAWSRFALEDVAFAALATLGQPLIAIVHNPVPRHAESVVARRARRLLRRRASVLVVHADRLRSRLEMDALDRVVVCPHPPYRHTAATPTTRGPALSTDRRWVAFIGFLRPDKGVDLLPRILDRVPPAARARLGLVVCGQGELPAATWDQIRTLGVATCDMTSPTPVPEEALLTVLAQRPLIIAPYVAATQSGTVILALSMGCRVLAFDEGGIPDVLSAEGLVPTGDVDAMARAIADDRGGTSAVPVSEWSDQAATAWHRVVEGVAASGRRVRPPHHRGFSRPATHLRSLLVRGSRWMTLGARTLVAMDRRWDTGRHTGWSDISHALPVTAADVVSVDVFDTVLIRRVPHDATVWWIVGAALSAEGAWTDPVASFVSARARAARDRSEAAIDDLYEHPALAMGCEPAHAAAVETAVEAELAVAAPAAVEALDTIRRTGASVVFVTDMHLGRAHLWATLADHGLAAAGDQLIVSSEEGRAKSSADVFSLVRSRGRDVIHFGNDLWSDVAMAASCGITARPLRKAEPSALETLMAGTASSVGAAIAGAARQVRLGCTDQPPAVGALVETGADVAGQCLTAFLLWVRDQCEQQSIGDITFLARDGELPLRMARAMPADHWDGARLCYLHASRRVWSIAAAACIGVDSWIARGTADDRGFIQHKRHVVPFASLLARLELTPSDLAAHQGLRDLDPNAPLPRGRGDDWHALLNSDHIREHVAHRAAARYALLTDYLGAWGLPDGRLAFVDVGWRGQLAWQISAVIRDMTGAEPVHLHFGGANVDTALADEVDIRRFAVDDSVAPLPFPHVVSCVETFTASGSRRARGLCRTSTGDVEVVFDEGSPLVANEARTILWDSAEAVARLLPSHATLARWQLDTTTLAAEVGDVLTTFWTMPTEAHAIAAAQLGYEVDDAGAIVGPVAQRYRLRELVTGGTPTTREWRHGSLVLTPQPLRAAVRAYLAVRDRRRIHS